MRRRAVLAACVAVSLTAACAPNDELLDDSNVNEGRDDSWSGGVRDPGDQVWRVSREWTDIAPNGETYEELYATWLASVEHTNGRDIHYTLADGTVVPAPSVECADTALSLRFIFAEEYGLPMFVSAGQYYFGHFGWIDRNGNRVRSYARYSLDAPRGSDADLAASARYLPDDLQEWPLEGPGTIGAYLDAAFTNKRFGYFMQDLWNMVYSGNLVENRNTFYVRPDFVRGGDLQLHRYDNNGGIGHTITIQRVERSSTGRLLDVDIIQSYMPTRPWIGDGYSELTGYTPNPSTGAGLRRWRRPVLSRGRWYLVADETVAAEASEVPGNPDRFEDLFGMTAEDEVGAMVETIETRRRALFDNPNSCRRREEREAAFGELYELYASTPELFRSLGFEEAPSVEAVRPAVDRLHRTVDDFIWSALRYEEARTCHWNPSAPDVNHDMYRATVARNRELLEAGGCEALRMFRAEGAEFCEGRDGRQASDPGACAEVPDGFDDLRSHAAANGLSWADYSNDEGGDLSAVATDGLEDPTVLQYFCEIFDSLEYWTQP